jgi:hypothetical protein
MTSRPIGYVYELPPIDHWDGWAHWQPDEATRVDEAVTHALVQFRARTAWEGDFADGPLISGLPRPDGDSWTEVIVGIKQGNNGTVFLWTPYALDWLDEWEVR